MIKLPAHRYDGETSNRQEVELCLFDTGEVQILCDGSRLNYRVEDMSSTPKVGRIRAQFMFTDGSVCEVGDHPDLDAALAMLPKQSRQNVVHKIENRLWAILVVLALAIVTLFGTIQYGIPAAAKQVAFMIPIEMETSMGEQAISFFDEHVCEPSKLSKRRQAQLKKAFQRSIKGLIETNIQINFRHCKSVGPNAFALPSGIIVFTDEMVKLAKHDNELVGVFAHEVGHVANRHIMRHILQDSVTGLLLILLTGDVGSASSLAATLPTVLVQAKFSRDFETESDDYAARFMRERNIPTRHLGDILDRMMKKYGGDDAVPGFLSSHPVTSERVKRLNLPAQKSK